MLSAGTQLVLSAVSQKLAPDAMIYLILEQIYNKVLWFPVKEATKPHRIIYGKTRVGGNIVYAETTSSIMIFYIWLLLLLDMK